MQTWNYKKNIAACLLNCHRNLSHVKTITQQKEFLFLYRVRVEVICWSHKMVFVRRGKCPLSWPKSGTCQVFFDLQSFVCQLNCFFSPLATSLTQAFSSGRLESQQCFWQTGTESLIEKLGVSCVFNLTWVSAVRFYNNEKFWARKEKGRRGGSVVAFEDFARGFWFWKSWSIFVSRVLKRIQKKL